MSGHSKWANIKRKKEVNDKQKSTIFGKLSRMITLAVLESSGVADPENNIKLRLAIDKAKLENLPKDNIERAIEKGSGPNTSNLREVVYEAFLPFGVAIMIQGSTDNSNKTLSEIKNLLESHGGKLATQGSVAYLFNKCAVIVFPKSKNSQESILEFSEKIKAIDIDEDENDFTVYFPYEYLGRVNDYIDNLVCSTPELDYKPTSTVTVNSIADVERIVRIIDSLEDQEDIHKVFSNLYVKF